MSTQTIIEHLEQRAHRTVTWQEEVKEGPGTGLHKIALMNFLYRASGRLTGTLSADRSAFTVQSDTFPLELTSRAQERLMTLQEGACEAIVTVWPIWKEGLESEPSLDDFEMTSMIVNCITPLKEDTPRPSTPFIFVGGLVHRVHDHGFEIVLLPKVSRSSKASPIYVRALGKITSRVGDPFCGLIRLMSLGTSQVWMLEREYQVAWRTFKKKKTHGKKKHSSKKRS